MGNGNLRAIYKKGGGVSEIFPFIFVSCSRIIVKILMKTISLT